MMRALKARYENGFLKPTEPLRLRQGEQVGVIVVRQPDPKRWDLDRIGKATADEEALATSGIEGWARALEAEDRR